MRQAMHRLTISTRGKKLVPFTHVVEEWISSTGIEMGLLTLWCRHTSASLLVQENADPTVRQDIENYFEDLVPESRHYIHSYEGPDDMPAHLRSILTGAQLSIPVYEGNMVLGTWQGLYLFEHRNPPHRREIVLHLMGD